MNLEAIVAAEQPPDDTNRREPYWWTEVVALIILAVASVLTAWSAYQSTRWSGIMAINFSQANTLRADSVSANTEAGQLLIIDVQSFLAWSESVANGDAEEAAFFRSRFRSEFRVAFDAWLQQPPGTTVAIEQVPPGTPFDTYRPSRFDEAESLKAQAEVAFEEARQANQRGDNYVLTTVLLAVVLFFAALGPRFRSHVLGAILTCTAGIFAVVALFLLVFQPISLSL